MSILTPASAAAATHGVTAPTAAWFVWPVVFGAGCQGLAADLARGDRVVSPGANLGTRLPI
jgi:hypothetical protein